MEGAHKAISGGCRSTQPSQMTTLLEEPSTSCDNNRYGWRTMPSTFEAVAVKNSTVTVENDDETTTNNEPGGCVGECKKLTLRQLEVPQDLQDTECQRCHNSEDNTETNNVPQDASPEMQQHQQGVMRRADSSGGIANVASLQADNDTESMSSIRSIGSIVCRICHNAEHPERLVSPCLCKGSLTYVHINCLEHWISTSGKTTCELCQFRYKTTHTLRYTCLQSLRMWYSHSMSRRALQEDCQMFSLLTLVAFGIVGTILVGIQYHVAQERSSIANVARIWTKGWLLFFLFTTFTVYLLNVYMIAKGQLSPWYRWWQSAREIKLILENRKSVTTVRRLEKPEETREAMSTHLQGAHRNMPIAEEEVAMGTVVLNVYVGSNGGRRHALVPVSSESDDTSTMQINNQQQVQEQQTQHEQRQQPHDEQQQQQDNHNQAAVPRVDI